MLQPTHLSENDPVVDVFQIEQRADFGVGIICIMVANSRCEYCHSQRIRPAVKSHYGQYYRCDDCGHAWHDGHTTEDRRKPARLDRSSDRPVIKELDRQT